MYVSFLAVCIAVACATELLVSSVEKEERLRRTLSRGHGAWVRWTETEGEWELLG
jgi:hypothetical protein